MNMRDAAGAPPTLFQPFKRNDFRLDEGYSEEMRSQTGSEMRAESRQGHVMEAENGLSTLVLPEYFGNLNETERSGMFPSAAAAMRVLHAGVLATTIILPPTSRNPCLTVETRTGQVEIVAWTTAMHLSWPDSRHKLLLTPS